MTAFEKNLKKWKEIQRNIEETNKNLKECIKIMRSRNESSE